MRPRGDDTWYDEGNIYGVGHCTSINEFDTAPKTKNPIGFAPSKKKAKSGGRPAGTFPKVGRL